MIPIKQSTVVIESIIVQLSLAYGPKQTENNGNEIPKSIGCYEIPTAKNEIKYHYGLPKS